MGTHKHYAQLETPTVAGCALLRSASLTLTTVSLVAIPWDAEQYDSHAYHSTSTNPSRITIPAGMAGVYDIRGTWSPLQTISGERVLSRLLLNGVEIGGSEAPGLNSCATPSFAMDRSLAVGDYIECAYYISAVTQTVTLHTGISSFSARRVGTL